MVNIDPLFCVYDNLRATNTIRYRLFTVINQCIHNSYWLWFPCRGSFCLFLNWSGMVMSLLWWHFLTDLDTYRFPLLLHSNYFSLRHYISLCFKCLACGFQRYSTDKKFKGEWYITGTLPILSHTFRLKQINYCFDKSNGFSRAP